MTECPWWERVSASVDRELRDDDTARVHAHLANCWRCAASLDAAAALRVSRVTTASEPSGDWGLDPGRMTDRERRWFGGRWARRMLLLAAVIIVVEALPAYVRGDGLGAESHAARHLAAWQIGFGVGLFVAAWVSRLSHAMLALAATFAALTVVATVIDVIGGHRGSWAESVHLVELIGVYLLWRLTPTHLLPWHRQATATLDDATSNDRRRDLRLVRSTPADTDDELRRINQRRRPPR